MRAGALTMLALLIAAATADAAVHVDPGSPAGKQYADSLDQARVDGGEGGDTAAVPGSTEEAPLFGEGITAEGPGREASSSNSGASPPELSPPASAADRRPGEGGQGGLLAAIIAIPVLAGAGLGLALRRIPRAQVG